MRTDSVNTPDTPDISILQLEEVFATFNKVSADLGSSYRELEARVSGLSEELTATQSARIQELTAKEQLAAKLSALMDALPGGVIAIDANGIIKEQNPVAIQILERDFQGKSWLHALENSTSFGPMMDGEITFQNGKRISISSSSYGEDGDTIILLTDVSENYRLNNLINREKRLAALGEMAARLAHQVRTPLSSAILYLSHLSTPAEGQTKSATITKKILNRLQKIERLVDGMLSFIRGDMNGNQEFSLNDLLSEVKDSVSLQIKHSNGSLKLICPDQECLINGDQEALFNALSNLVENAIQAVANKPAITLSLSKDNAIYNISVSDNGPGIDPSIRERVFEPFFSTRTVGTGLGLAVVLSTVKAHNGEICIDTAEGGGTVFQLLIPTDLNNSAEESGIWGVDPQQLISEESRQIPKTNNRKIVHG